MTQSTRPDTDARREAIVEAAARVFARKGLRSARMADIAEEANLTAGALYRYFPGKNELMREVFQDAVSRNLRVFEDEAQSGGSPMGTLERVGRRLLLDSDDWDSLVCQMQMTVEAARDPDDFGADLSRTRQEIRKLLATTIERAQDAGEITPDIDPAVLGALLHAASSGIQMLKLEHDDTIDTGAILDLLVRMVTGMTPVDANPAKGSD